MRKLLLTVLLPLFFGLDDSRPIGNHEEYIDDDETCSKGPWMDFPAFLQNTIDMMIWTQSERDVTFLTFTGENKQEPYYVTNENFTSWIAGVNGFDPTIKNVFIIHGFKDDYAPWARTMKDAFLLREECNVFIVEWGQSSETWSGVFKNIPRIGKQVAVFIQNLMKSKGVDPEKVHVIGHSAGAQSAGFAGKEIKQMAKKPLGRITGLDPAGPSFYSAGPDQRLDATDASFVDIIHTNMGCTRMEGLGYPGAIGHFDFYPNGGQLQPGCLTMPQFLGKIDFAMAKITSKYLFGSLSRDEIEIVNHMLCSHQRPYEYFTASILNESCEFYSVQCSGWNRYLSGQCEDNEKVVMGYHADRYKDFAEDGVHKKFFINTTAYEPYCI